jgi:hypothetical protein
MIVYHYDSLSGVYLNTASEAEPDPMDPGKWLIPANSTPLVPPSPPDPKLKQAVFRNGDWLIEPIPADPPLRENLEHAPEGGMWPRMSIKEALKGGVT